jgi:hypothetical protein
MYDMMNGGTMWGMGSSWFLTYSLVLFGVIAVLIYLFLARRR